MNRIPEDEMDEIESRAWSQPVDPRLLSALREAYQEIDRVRGLFSDEDARILDEAVGDIEIAMDRCTSAREREEVFRDMEPPDPSHPGYVRYEGRIRER